MAARPKVLANMSLEESENFPVWRTTSPQLTSPTLCHTAAPAAPTPNAAPAAPSLLLAVCFSESCPAAPTKFAPATNVTIDLIGALLSALFKSNTPLNSTPTARFTGNGGSLVLAGTKCINGIPSAPRLANGVTFNGAGTAGRAPTKSLYHPPN